MRIIKLKKIVTSKKFIAGSLVVLCVGILIVCFKLQGNEKDEFVSNTYSSPTPAVRWSGKPSLTPTELEKEIETNKNVVTNAPKKEEYPKVVKSDESKTVVDFTDTSQEKPPAPSAPEGKTEIANHVTEHTVQSNSTATPTPSMQQSKQETKQKNKQESKQKTKQKTHQKSKAPTPAPKGKKSKGKVYDPAFGWITVPEGTSIPTDNDGDINKQVGTMGD